MVYVVTAVYNRKNITTRFVECLKKQTYAGGIRFIMVDDGSIDGTDNEVRAIYPDVVVYLKRETILGRGTSFSTQIFN